MEIPTENSATWLSTSKKILYFFYNNIRVFFGRILHSTFRPKSYAQTIKIGDESDFFNSLNFLFVSISFYLTVCSIFILMSPNHAKLQLNTNDFLHFMRIMVETFIIGLTCYFLLFILTKRRITFTNFLHSWFHISAILVFYGVFNLLMASIFFPPLGENSQYFLDIIAGSGEAGRQLVENCKQDMNDVGCRIIGTPGAWAIYVGKIAVKLHIIDNSNNDLLLTIMMTVIALYYVTFVLLSAVFVAWFTHVQSTILKVSLNISYLTALCVIIYHTAIFVLLMMAFPGLASLAGYVIPSFN